LYRAKCSLRIINSGVAVLESQSPTARVNAEQRKLRGFANHSKVRSLEKELTGVLASQEAYLQDASGLLWG
jgi:hypothetical protein